MRAITRLLGKFSISWQLVNPCWLMQCTSNYTVAGFALRQKRLCRRLVRDEPADEPALYDGRQRGQLCRPHGQRDAVRPVRRRQRRARHALIVGAVENGAGRVEDPTHDFPHTAQPDKFVALFG